MLALGEESFEDELRRIVSTCSSFFLAMSLLVLCLILIESHCKLKILLQGISTMHLTPFEVLTAINHAQLRLKRTFKEEEFTSGEVGKLMIAEDFDFETTVSLFNTNSS